MTRAMTILINDWDLHPYRMRGILPGSDIDGWARLAAVPGWAVLPTHDDPVTRARCEGSRLVVRDDAGDLQCDEMPERPTMSCEGGQAKPIPAWECPACGSVLIAVPRFPIVDELAEIDRCQYRIQHDGKWLALHGAQSKKSIRKMAGHLDEIIEQAERAKAILSEAGEVIDSQAAARRAAKAAAKAAVEGGDK